MRIGGGLEQSPFVTTHIRRATQDTHSHSHTEHIICICERQRAECWLYWINAVARQHKSIRRYGCSLREEERKSVHRISHNFPISIEFSALVFHVFFFFSIFARATAVSDAPKVIDFVFIRFNICALATGAALCRRRYVSYSSIRSLFVFRNITVRQNGGCSYWEGFLRLSARWMKLPAT